MVKRTGINRSFTGSTGRGGLSQSASAADLGDKADSETTGGEICPCATRSTPHEHPSQVFHFCAVLFKASSLVAPPGRPAEQDMQSVSSACTEGLQRGEHWAVLLARATS